MSSAEVTDFLTKELLIENNVVTFRSLSRRFRIHVNAAKNELAKYYGGSQSSESRPAATYLVIGEVHSLHHAPNGSSQDTDEMTEMDYDDDDDDAMGCMKIILVGEAGLEAAKSQLLKVNSISVYSLSPAPIREAGLICSPTDSVREVDNNKGQEFASVVGRIVGAHVQMKVSKGKTPVVASKLKLAAVPKAAPIVKKEVKEATIQSEKGKEKESDEKAKRTEKEKEPVVKFKPTGKLDWSRAKTQEVKKVEPKPAKEKKEEEGPPFVASSSKVAEAETSSDEEPVIRNQKRGVKRKPVSALAIDDDESPPNSPSSSKLPLKAGARLKKGVIVSDDEISDRPVIPRKRAKGSAKAVTSDSERSLRAMMDVDDDLVDRASRSQDAVPQEGDGKTEDDGMDVDEEMSETKPVVKPKTKKTKKVVPVGHNGLKKKRVVKSRTKFDTKGYMVTEDYSSYESVDEEEPKPKRKEKKTVPVGRNGLKKKRVIKSRSSRDEKGHMVAEDYSSYESVHEEETKPPQTKAKRMAAPEQKKDGESEAGDSQLPETGKEKEKEKAKAQPRKIIKPGGTSKTGGQRSLASFFGGKK